MTLHRNLSGAKVHVPHAFEYADATAREAATGFVPADVGKLALQLDDFSFWVLSDDDPATWVAVGGSAPAPAPGWLNIKDFVYPSSSGWSWDNQGSGTIDSAAGWEYQYCANHGGVQLQGRYCTPVNAHYQIDVALLNTFGARNSGGQTGLFFGFRDSGGKLVGFFDWDEGAGTMSISVFKWNSTTSVNSAYVKASSNPNLQNVTNPVFYRIQYDGTNIKFYRTADTYHYELAYSVALTDFLASGKPDVFWGAYCNGGSFATALISWEETALA